MTVEQLIIHLQQYAQNSKVAVEGHDAFYALTEIKTIKAATPRDNGPDNILALAQDGQEYVVLA